jgi:hypothetical protein
MSPKEVLYSPLQLNTDASPRQTNYLVNSLRGDTARQTTVGNT